MDEDSADASVTSKTPKWNKRDVNLNTLAFAFLMVVIVVMPMVVSATSPRIRIPNNTAEFELRSYLFTNYRMVRPVQRASDSLHVMTRLFPIKIQELVEKEERIVLTVRVQLGWVDKTMAWDPADFYNQTSVVLPYDVKIWLPELQIVNSALDMYGIFSMRDRKSPVKAHSNGEIWWHPTGRMDVRCELQLMYFPFDFQRCGIVLEPVIYTQDQLNLTLRVDRSPVTLSMYSENGLWDLVKTGGRQEIYWVSGATGFSRVEFVLYLQRRTTYYKMNIIFPCLLLSILQLLTFILPIDNEERVPQATTILLSVIVFQTVIVDQLPKSSTSMSLLAMYISTLVGISTATVASSIICSLFISLRPSCFQVPKCFESLIRRCVTKLPARVFSGDSEADMGPFAQTNMRRCRSIRRRRSLTPLTNSLESNAQQQRIHHRQSVELSNINENVWQPNLVAMNRPKTSYANCQSSPEMFSSEPKAPQDALERTVSLSPNKSTTSVFMFHERQEYVYRYSPNMQRRQPTVSNISPNSTPLLNHQDMANNTNATSLMHYELSPSSSQRHEQRDEDDNRSGGDTDGDPKPPYVLVIDWCRMSHIINAAMFTLCLCLDVLVPAVLFLVMPPVNPPTD